MAAACTMQLPKDAICPISQHVMEDPVVCADGHSYERRCIQEWFTRGHKTSPKTNEPLQSTALIPNISLRNTIEDLTKQMPTSQKGQVLLARVQLRQNLRQRLDLMEEIGQEPPHCIPGRTTSCSGGFLSARCTNSTGLRWETDAANDLRSQRRRGSKKPFSGERLNAYASYLGIDPVADPDFLWIAVDSLEAPLPAHWSEHRDASDRVYYFNAVTHESRWRHPMEKMYRDAHRTISSFRYDKMSSEERIQRLDELRCQARRKEASCQEELSLWTEHIDDSSQRFYFNAREQQSTWTDPRPAVREALDLQLKALSIAALTATADSPLPLGDAPQSQATSNSSAPAAQIAQSPCRPSLMTASRLQETRALNAAPPTSYWGEFFSAFRISSSTRSASDTIVAV